MKRFLENRALKLGEYMVQEKATVRKAAKCFGVSKSTVHKDLTERLPQINEAIALRVREILEVNKAERHLRGGEATKLKYRQAHESH